MPGNRFSSSCGLALTLEQATKYNHAYAENADHCAAEQAHKEDLKEQFHSCKSNRSVHHRRASRPLVINLARLHQHPRLGTIGEEDQRADGEHERSSDEA